MKARRFTICVGIEVFAEEQIAVCEDAGFFKNEEPPIIVGHSFGGFITILTGALYGERLAGTVIVDSPVNPPERPGGPPHREFRPHRIYPTIEEAMGRFRLAPPQPCENLYIVDYIARHSLKQAPNPDGKGTGWTWKFDPAIWQRFDIGDMSARLAATRCRIAIMRGEFSVLLPAEIGDYMFGLLGRSAPVIEIPQARHHALLKKAEIQDKRASDMADNKTVAGWGAEMRPEEHIGTYDAFITGAKWGVGALTVLLVLMAIFLL